MSHDTSRRGFMTNVARIGIAAAIAAVAVRLFGRDLGDEHDSPQSPCRACGLLDRCNRPEGVRERSSQSIEHSRQESAPGSRGACGESPDGPLVSRWVRKEEA